MEPGTKRKQKPVPVSHDYERIRAMEPLTDSEPKQQCLPRLKVVNLVATAELGQIVDLSKLVNVKGFAYDQTVYPCAYLKDRVTKAKVIIFSTGKMICTGARSLGEARSDLEYATKRLAKLRMVEPARINAKLRNIVATAELGHRLNVETLATKLSNVIYEPEQFPGAIYYPKILEGASILVFASGKVVVAGLRRTELLSATRRVLKDLAHLC